MPTSLLWRRRDLLPVLESHRLDHIVEIDHVTFLGGAGFDGLIHSAQDLALAPDLSVFLGVYLLALRHPVTVARQLADIELTAPGKLVLGVGVGGEDRHEIALCGVDPRTRGRRTDECIKALRGLLTGEPFSYRGAFVDFEDAHIAPAPADAIPIVVGGRSDAALRRAGRLGDGWVAIWVSHRRFGEAVKLVQESADVAGRAVDGWHHAIQLWCGIDDNRDRARALVSRDMNDLYHVPFDKFERWTPVGTPHDVAEFVAPYIESGARYVNLMVSAVDPEQSIAMAGEVRLLLLAG